MFSSKALHPQISRMHVMDAGDAIYWALSGAGGPQLAQATVGQLDAMQADIGCSDPLSSALKCKRIPNWRCEFA